MRWVYRLLGVLVALVIVAAGALFFLPKERIAAIAIDQVRAQTGRELTVSGDLSLSFWPVLAITTGPVTLSNADWAGAEPMLTADTLSIGVDPIGLLSGNIAVKQIEIMRPTLRLATRADGTGNWAFGAQASQAGTAAPAEAPGSSRSLTIERLRISDAELIFTPADGAAVSVSDLSAQLDWPGSGAPAEFAVSLTRGGAPVEMEGRIDDFPGFLDGNLSPVELALQSGGGRIGFAGSAGLGADATGQAEVALSETADFLANLGVATAAPPLGLGRRIESTAEITVTSGNRLSLRDLVIALDGNRMTGSADVALGAVPVLTASLQAGALDFSALGAAGGAGGGAAPAGNGWSTAPIDASALAMMNGEVKLNAASLDLGAVRLGETALALTLDRSRAVLQLERIAIFEGTVTGELVANNRNGLSVGGNVTASAVDLQAMLRDMAGITRLSGQAEGQVTFLGAGASVDAIMKSLSGDGALSTGRGVFSGIDLDRLMRRGDASGGTTVFDRMSASFTMQDGTLRNDDLLVLLANFRAEGAGRVGLGARDLDYTFTPIALRADTGEALAIPVRIQGPWSGPRIIPDLGQALQLDAEGAVEAVTRGVTDQIDRTLQDQLGVTRPDGQSTEDVIRKGIEGEARDQLRKLLGGD